MDFTVKGLHYFPTEIGLFGFFFGVHTMGITF